MISPSLVMTAAHCIDWGPGKPHIYGIWFTNYRNRNSFDHTFEYFDCLEIPFYSLQASDSDVMIMMCEPNTAGILPGDKYGFFDTYNLSDVSIGAPVASFWSNPVTDDENEPRTILYSWGDITNNRSTAWPPVSCETGINHWAIESDLYSNPGCSGSVWVYPGYGVRTLSAPTSTGVTEGYYRTSTLLSNVLWGDADDNPWVLEFIDQDDPNPGLCNQSLRVHQMDENSDGLFDPVTEIDSNLAGRQVFALNFDARHRRAMWILYPNPPTLLINFVWQTFPYWVSTEVYSNYNYQVWRLFMKRTLPLITNRKYDVRVEYRRQDPTKSLLSLKVVFSGAGCTYAGTTYTKEYNYSTDPVEPKMFTFRVDTTGCTENPTLYFYLYYNRGIIVDRVTVQISGAQWSFDYWDTREEWRRDNDGGHALITPDGLGVGDNQSWAATCFGGCQTWNENCQNRAIPLLPSTDYRLTFWHKVKVSSSDPAYVLVRSKTAYSQGENNVLFQEFTPTSGWNYNAYTFHTNNYHEYYISFGQKYDGEYYIDSVVATKL